MSTSNRYLLSECDLGQLSTLDESKEKKTILWWMVWQAMGDIPTETQIDLGHGNSAVRLETDHNMIWDEGEPAPREPLFGDREKEMRPSLEAVLDALGKAGLVTIFGPPDQSSPLLTRANNNWTVEVQSFEPGAWGISDKALSLYLAACRALLAFRRGRG